MSENQRQRIEGRSENQRQQKDMALKILQQIAEQK